MHFGLTHRALRFPNLSLTDGNKSAIYRDSSFRSISERGSNGALDSALSTNAKSHRGGADREQQKLVRKIRQGAHALNHWAHSVHSHRD